MPNHWTFPQPEPRLRRRVTWDGGGRSSLGSAVGGGGGVLAGAQEHGGALQDEYAGKHPAAQRQENTPAVNQDPAIVSTAAIATADDETTLNQQGPQVGALRFSRLIADVDSILLLHTQLQHRKNTLVSLRSYLKESLDNFTTTLASNGLLAIDADGRVSSDGPTTHVTRSSSETIDQLSVKVNPDVDSNSPSNAVHQRDQAPKNSDPEPDLITQLRNLRQDLERVNDGERDFSTALESLSQAQYRLNEQQKALFEDLKHPFKAAQIVDQIAKNEQALYEIPQVLRSPSPASDIPSLVDRYFDRRGDVGVWLERREELLEAWAEGLAEREFIADRGDELEVTDEEFKSRYVERQTHIENELQRAQEEADFLQDLCQDEGYDIETYRITRRSETASNFSERLNLSLRLQALPEIEVAPQAPPTLPRKLEKVTGWLDDMSQIDIPSGDDMPLSPSVEASEIPLPQSSKQSDDSPALDSVALLRELGHGGSSSDAKDASAFGDLSSDAKSPAASNSDPFTNSITTTDAVPEPPRTSSPNPLSLLSAGEHTPGRSLSQGTVPEAAMTQPTAPSHSVDQAPMETHPAILVTGSAQHCDRED